MRLFLAINVTPEVRRDLSAVTAPLRDCAPELAWVKEPLLHLTVKFLGEQPAERLDDIQATLASVAGRHRELILTRDERMRQPLPVKIPIAVAAAAAGRFRTFGALGSYGWV